MNTETDLQKFLILLRQNNPTLAEHLTIECQIIMKEMIHIMGSETFDAGVYDMAEQIADVLDNYYPSRQTETK